jgi:hypothetical protein
MLMRHHWGWGIGHIHSQAAGTKTPEQEDILDSDGDSQFDQPKLDSEDEGDHGLEERENEDLRTYSDEHDDYGEGDHDVDDDETLWTSHEMFETQVI